jgi:hypothetical protein
MLLNRKYNMSYLFEQLLAQFEQDMSQNLFTDFQSGFLTKELDIKHLKIPQPKIILEPPEANCQDGTELSTAITLISDKSRANSQINPQPQMNIRLVY